MFSSNTVHRFVPIFSWAAQESDCSVVVLDPDHVWKACTQVGPKDIILSCGWIMCCLDANQLAIGPKVLVHLCRSVSGIDVGIELHGRV